MNQTTKIKYLQFGIGMYKLVQIGEFHRIHIIYTNKTKRNQQIYAI